MGKAALALCNVVLILAAVLFTVFYSNGVRTTQEQMMRETFCNTVDTMRQISERYLSGELEDAAGWAAYVEQEHLTMDEAMDYIRAVSDQTECEAHFVDMDTFAAWSTKSTGGSNSIDVYRKYFLSDQANLQGYVTQMRGMFAGEKYVLGKYKIQESQRNVISVGCTVTLRQADGSDRAYLLLRVVPVERMKQLWLFPVNYPTAEIGLIAPNSDYVIPSNSMRAENFMEFVRSYTFPDNYNGADEMLAQLKEQESGLMELNNSRSEPCYWYYSRLEGFQNLDILGYIPAADLAAEGSNISIVLVVAGILLLLAMIDGNYILRINRRLRETAAVAEQASNAKTQFLSSMSHDIRTPLNAVLGMTELAQNHMDDPKYVQDCLRKISLSGSHLLTLINDILEISRVESGRVSINPTPFEVRDLVSGLESITRSQAVGHGLRLDIQVEALPEPWLMGDKLRLTQVYLNLLNNAVKYTTPGGSIRLTVREEARDGGGVVFVCVVQDTGIGMSPEFQETMYDSFTRVSDSRVDKIQGTGLGLAIVKRMVDLMHGTIDCVSAEGEGTTFTVRIPLETAHEARQQETAPQETNRDLTDLHLLVAEDNDLNWEIISALLDGCGISCDRAENGQVCVDLLTAAPPGTYDVVLMDVQMPVLNGREATQVLRRGTREDLRQIPIIAMTADAFAEDVQMCLDAGMDAHVAKPIELEKVLVAIRRVLAAKRQADG